MVIAVKPPSTGTTAPVTKEAAFGDASQTTAPDSSSASPYRPIGVCPKMDFLRSSVRILRFCSAGKNPGIMALTRMLSGAHSRARNRRSEEHTSELQSRGHLVCRLLLEKKKHE